MCLIFVLFRCSLNNSRPLSLFYIFILKAIHIFIHQSPIDEQPLDSCYMDCLESGIIYDACTITGQCINQERIIQCNRCHHYMIERKTKWISACPLCHSSCADACNVSVRANDDIVSKVAPQITKSIMSMQC